MSGKLEIILCCNAALKRLPITMRQSALTVKLLNCQSGYQKRWAGGCFVEVGCGGGGGGGEGGGGGYTRSWRLINTEDDRKGGGAGRRRSRGLRGVFGLS